jgi:hypothetical protein
MVLNMRDIGKMTYNMVMVLKHGLMDLSMRVTTMKARSMGKEHTPGVMDRNTLETGSITRLMDKEFTLG